MAQQANKGCACPVWSATLYCFRAFGAEHEDRCCRLPRYVSGGQNQRGVGEQVTGHGSAFLSAQGRRAEVGWGHLGPGGAGDIATSRPAYQEPATEQSRRYKEEKGELNRRR